MRLAKSQPGHPAPVYIHGNKPPRTMAKERPLKHQREVGHNAHPEQTISVGNWTKEPYGGYKRFGGVLKVNPGGIHLERDDDKHLIVYRVEPACLMWQALCRLQASSIIDVLGAEEAGHFVRMAREIVTNYTLKG